MQHPDFLQAIKPTPEQRVELYERAITLFIDCKATFICHCLIQLLVLMNKDEDRMTYKGLNFHEAMNSLDCDNLPMLFPELVKYKPAHLDWGTIWFPLHDKASRIKILYKAIGDAKELINSK